MAKQSQAWKALERRAAAVLCGVRDPRPWFSFEVRPDCIVEDFNIRVDCKRRKTHTHHTTFHECQRKYCADEEHMVIVTAEHGDREPLAVIELSYLADLLNEIRKKRGTNDEPPAVSHQCIA